MNIAHSTAILSYINSHSRNKIIFYKGSHLGINSIDIGRLLAQSLFNYRSEDQLPMRASLELDKILNRAVYEHSRFGKILAIANLGILFEPELKQDFYRIIDNYSTNNLLFIEWEGAIADNTLCFLSEEKGIKININNLSHISL